VSAFPFTQNWLMIFEELLGKKSIYSSASVLIFIMSFLIFNEGVEPCVEEMKETHSG